jgi:hypothetical protein
MLWNQSIEQVDYVVFGLKRVSPSSKKLTSFVVRPLEVIQQVLITIPQVFNKIIPPVGGDSELIDFVHLIFFFFLLHA